MATSTGTSSTATTTAISTAVPSTAGTATPTVTFTSLMTAMDASVSRQVEAALARALGDHSRTASCPSHSTATPSSVITIPSTSAALAGMSLLCIFSVNSALFSSPYYVQFLVYHSWPSHFHVQKRCQFFFCSWPLFSAPFSELTTHSEQAPASHSCSHSCPRHQRFQSPTLGSARSLSLRPRSPRHRHFAAYASCCFLIIILSTVIYIFINCVFCFVLHNRYGPLVQLSSFSPADLHCRGWTTNSHSNPSSHPSYPT